MHNITRIPAKTPFEPFGNHGEAAHDTWYPGVISAHAMPPGHVIEGLMGYGPPDVTGQQPDKVR